MFWYICGGGEERLQGSKNNVHDKDYCLPRYVHPGTQAIFPSQPFPTHMYTVWCGCVTILSVTECEQEAALGATC